MAVKLIYKDVALGADEDAEVTTTAAESFSDVAAIPFGAETLAVATCEPNSWGLVNDYKVRDNQTFAFWSAQRSGADCYFSNPPTITLDFTNQYTATGLTVRFSPGAMEYCTQISVTWYQGETIKASGTYYPETPLYVVPRTVEVFDKIVFSFEKTSLPNRRVKIEQIIIGVVREFTGKELKNVSFMHEISPIADTVPVNVMDASFHSANDIDFVFQRKQPVEGYNGSELIGVYYIETGMRTGARDYSIACQDAIGVLEIDEYTGGIWIEDTPLTTILSEVFGDVFEFDIAPAYADSTLRGYIEPGTKRAALQQIAFALGAIVDTSGTHAIRIYPPNTGTPAEISPKQTYTGGSVTVADKVTEVTVTAYIFFDERPSDEQEFVEVNGVQYRYYTDTKHSYNPEVVSTDLPNKIKFTGCYLCNLSNAQKVCDNILAHYMRRESYNVKHVLDAQETGKRASVYLPWSDPVNGTITRMSISVTGLAVSDSTILIDN